MGSSITGGFISSFGSGLAVFSGGLTALARSAETGTLISVGFDPGGAALASCTSHWQLPDVSRRESSCPSRSEEHTSELQSLAYLVCRLLLEKKKKNVKSCHRTYCTT